MVSVRIESVTSRLYRLPPTLRWEDSTHHVSALEYVVTDIETDTGLVGTGLSYTTGVGGTAIVALVDDYCARMLVGEDALAIGRHWETLGKQLRRSGTGRLRAADGKVVEDNIPEDQSLVIDTDKGLVVITGCGHAGAVNIVRHASRLTSVPTLHALIGGFHLGGPAFEPIIGRTVDALAELAPDLVVPGHCTGWRAQHALAAALPDAWVASSSGSSYHLTAA